VKIALPLLNRVLFITMFIISASYRLAED